LTLFQKSEYSGQEWKRLIFLAPVLILVEAVAQRWIVLIANGWNGQREREREREREKEREKEKEGERKRRRERRERERERRSAVSKERLSLSPESRSSYSRGISLSRSGLVGKHVRHQLSQWTVVLCPERRLAINV
jgi:hypothetical protein